MIFGNPERFAISWELVPAWDTQRPRFYEGLFLAYVNGFVFPWMALGSSDVWRNLREFNNAMKEHEKQNKMNNFLGGDSLVYKKLLAYSFEGDESKWEYRADSEAISDRGVSLFLIKKEDSETIYAGFRDDFLTSIRLELNEFSLVVNQATKFFFKKYPEALQKNFD